MPRKRSVSEVQEEESKVTNSPLRRSTRILMNSPVPSSIETRRSSANADNRVTRSMSKSPTELSKFKEVGAKLNRRRASEELAEQQSSTPKGVLTRRRSLRSNSESPSKKETETTLKSEISKRRGRKTLVTDKLILLDKIEENDTTIKISDKTEENQAFKDSNNYEIDEKQNKKTENVLDETDKDVLNKQDLIKTNVGDGEININNKNVYKNSPPVKAIHTKELSPTLTDKNKELVVILNTTTKSKSSIDSSDNPEGIDTRILKEGIRDTSELVRKGTEEPDKKTLHEVDNEKSFDLINLKSPTTKNTESSEIKNKESPRIKNRESFKMINTESISRNQSPVKSIESPSVKETESPSMKKVESPTKTDRKGHVVSPKKIPNEVKIEPLKLKPDLPTKITDKFRTPSKEQTENILVNASQNSDQDVESNKENSTSNVNTFDKSADLGESFNLNLDQSVNTPILTPLNSSFESDDQRKYYVKTTTLYKHEILERIKKSSEEENIDILNYTDESECDEETCNISASEIAEEGQGSNNESMEGVSSESSRTMEISKVIKLKQVSTLNKNKNLCEQILKNKSSETDETNIIQKVTSCNKDKNQTYLIKKIDINDSQKVKSYVNQKDRTDNVQEVEANDRQDQTNFILEVEINENQEGATDGIQEGMINNIQEVECDSNQEKKADNNQEDKVNNIREAKSGGNQEKESDGIQEDKINNVQEVETDKNQGKKTDDTKKVQVVEPVNNQERRFDDNQEHKAYGVQEVETDENQKRKTDNNQDNTKNVQDVESGDNQEKINGDQKVEVSDNQDVETKSRQEYEVTDSQEVEIDGDDCFKAKVTNKSPIIKKSPKIDNKTLEIVSENFEVIDDPKYTDAIKNSKKPHDKTKTPEIKNNSPGITSKKNLRRSDKWIIENISNETENIELSDISEFKKKASKLSLSPKDFKVQKFKHSKRVSLSPSTFKVENIEDTHVLLMKSYSTSLNDIKNSINQIEGDRGNANDATCYKDSVEKEIQTNTSCKQGKRKSLNFAEVKNGKNKDDNTKIPSKNINLEENGDEEAEKDDTNFIKNIDKQVEKEVFMENIEKNTSTRSSSKKEIMHASVNIDDHISNSSKTEKDKIEKNKKVLKAKSHSKNTTDEELDVLVKEHTFATSSDDEDYETNKFFDYSAEEGEEETPSEGSNDISCEGESLHSEYEIESDNESYEDSFIDDEEQESKPLLGEEYDLKLEPTKNKKRKRIVQVDSSDEDEPLNNIENTFLINSNDNLISLEEIKNSSSNSKQISNQTCTELSGNGFDEIKLANKFSTPCNSVNIDRKKCEKKTSINILENMRVEDITDENLKKRISEVMSKVCSESLDASGNVSLNISIDIDQKTIKSDSPVTDINSSKMYKEENSHKSSETELIEHLPIDIKKKRKNDFLDSCEDEDKEYLKKRNSLEQNLVKRVDLKIKKKKLKNKEKIKNKVSQIEVNNKKIKTCEIKEVGADYPQDEKETMQNEISQSTLGRVLSENDIKNVKKTSKNKRRKKKKTNSQNNSNAGNLDENEASKKKKDNFQKKRAGDLLEIGSPPKKKKLKSTSQSAYANIVLANKHQTEKKSKMFNNDWDITYVSFAVKPSKTNCPNNVIEKKNIKDFKNFMINNPMRNVRMDSIELLKKKSKNCR